jgi:hypothetical protein
MYGVRLIHAHGRMVPCTELLDIRTQIPLFQHTGLGQYPYVSIGKPRKKLISKPDKLQDIHNTSHATTQVNSNMALDRLLFLILLVPYGQVKQLYAISLVPWLVTFSIPFLIVWSRPQRPIYAISLIVLLSLHIAAQMVYDCYPDEKEGQVLVYSRQKCTNSKLVLFTTVAISTVAVLKRAWR